MAKLHDEILNLLETHPSEFRSAYLIERIPSAPNLEEGARAITELVKEGKIRKDRLKRWYLSPMMFLFLPPSQIADPGPRKKATERTSRREERLLSFLEKHGTVKRQYIIEAFPRYTVNAIRIMIGDMRDRGLIKSPCRGFWQLA